MSSDHAKTPGVIANIEVKVDKKKCDPVKCPEGEIQDLYMCNCIAMRPVLGELVDTRDKKISSDQLYRFDVDAKFTFREYAVTPGKYQWQGPQV